ncbi:MAG: MFS transporter [Halobacteriales archaeon]|nr:MFS transporter [Halobacteriales archaeon]
MTPLVGTDDWRVTVGLVSGGHFLSHFYILAFPPLFPMLRSDFALSNTELGVLVSIISLAGLLQMPVGSLVDRFGAKRVLVVGLSLTAIGTMLVGTANSYPMMLVFALLAGLGQSTFHPADYSLIDAATKPDTEGRAFSVHTFGGYAGFAAAPLVVGTLALRFDWRVALLATGAFGLVFAGLLMVLLDAIYLRQLDEQGPESDTQSSLRSDLQALLKPTILIMFAFFLVLTMGSKGISTFTPLLMVDTFGLTESVGNTTLTGFFTGAATGVLLGGMLADRYEPSRIIVLCLSIAALLLWMTVGGIVTLTSVTAIGLFGIIGFVSGLVYPSRDRLVNAFSTAGSTGRSFGFVFTGISVGGLISPTLLGAVIDASTPVWAFLIVGGFYLAAAVIAFAIGTGAVTRTTPSTKASGD